MELKQYLSIVLRWTWLLILGLVLGAAAGYYLSIRQTPVYEASTRLLVMRPPLEQSSDLTYYSDLQLVQTYIQLLTTQPVLDGAAGRLGYEVEKSQIEVKQNQETQIIALTVEDPGPKRAADIANVLLAVLTEQNESLQAGRYASTEESIQAQIAQVESQINKIQGDVDQITSQSLQQQLAEVKSQIKPLEDEVATLQKEIAGLQPDRYTKASEVLERRAQIAEKQARIDQIEPLLNLYQEIYSNLVVLGKPVDSGANGDARLARLQSTLDLYQNLYTNLLGSLETIRLARLQNTPNIVQIEPAAVPKSPIRPRPLANTALAAAVGLMLAAGLVFLIEYLDDSLKTPEDVERTLGLPVLGFVAQMKYHWGKEDLVVTTQPRSPVSEAFRALRTNLEFASVEKPICTILVTSPGPSEGKTTVAANLAAVLSITRKRVVLLDADMRRPHTHSILGIPNTRGLSSLFLEQDHAGTISQSRKDLPNLWTITSGDLPPNPAELLGSAKMERILEALKNRVEAVVIDSPPSLVADSQILAAKVDAVLLVIQPGKTKAETAQACLESLQRSGARILGVVLNRIPRNRSYYYGGYKYYGAKKGYFSKPEASPALEERLRTSTQTPVRQPAPPAVHKSPDGGRDLRQSTPTRAPSLKSLFENLRVAPDRLPDPREHKPAAHPSDAESAIASVFPGGSSRG